jgi:hypothetical protein
MQLAIDIRYKRDLSPGPRRFYEQVLLAMATTRPDNTYLFITNKNSKIGQPEGNNYIFQPTGYGPINWLDQKKLIARLNEIRASRYLKLEADGFAVFGASNNIFSGKTLKSPLSKIIFTQDPASNTLKAPTGFPITYVRPVPVSAYPSLSWAAAESVKTKYSGGRDYFLFAGDLDAGHQLIDLLKAFSIFKKWQQSNMQLLLAGSETAWTDILEEKLSTYKYKSDVVLLKGVAESEMAGITAAAYALLYPCLNNRLPIELLQAVQLGMASIVSDLPSTKAITQAAIWVNNNDVQNELAKAMILLYKDEQQKLQLQDLAKMEVENYTSSMLLTRLWQILEQE